MWVCFYLVTALYVAACSACGGCRMDPSKTTETVCSDSTDQFMEFAYDGTTITETCDLITKGKKNWKVPIQSVELTVSGFVGERNVSFHLGDMCKALKEGIAHLNGREVEDLVKMYDIPTCDESVTARNEVRQRKIKHHHRHNNLSKRSEGAVEIEMRLENINGNENDSVCLFLKSEIVCDKKE